MTKLRLAVPVLLLALSGCAAEFAAVSLDAICAPPAPDSTTFTCVYAETCGNTLVGRATLDAATAQLPFRLPIQIDNALTDNTASAGINTNGAVIRSFEVTYSGGPYVAPWSTNVNIRIPTAGTTVYEVPLIPVQYFSTLKPSSPAAVLDLLVNVRAHGVFDSQDNFTTAWFAIPVDVCNGCLSVSPLACPGGLAASCPATGSFTQLPGQTASIICVGLQ